MKKKNDKIKISGKWINVIWAVVCSMFIFIGFLALFSVNWYIDTYGDLGFDSILFTLFSGLNGVQSGLIESYLLKGFLPALLCTFVVSFVLNFKWKKKIEWNIFNDFRCRIFPLGALMKCIVSFVLMLILVFSAASKVGLFAYINSYRQQSEIFQDEYIDPLSVKIDFPEEKKNLIYIFLESMETTYLSRENGGALEYDLIPELFELGEQNINFSHNDTVGGYELVYGTNWTAGGMVAHTAGIPLKTPSDMDVNSYGADSFLPGVTSITNILKDNGYYQALMLGSDARFANKDQYYSQHGIDTIYDLFTAREDGIVPDDYYVWWGMEDKYLYEYAKQELVKIASRNEPFSFTMLTVDTHHIGGYACENCDNVYSENYENVISCASRQLYDFIEWVATQPFYEETTIVICGDHVTMDAGYISRNVSEDYARRVYNCFINSEVDSNNTKNRRVSALDMFPTTLAAMGCTIEGDRLGLGTNLFSEKPTLIEELSIDVLHSELSKDSDYYISKFMF